jgi:eukaryotic-like serine/threonine-protein kinase
MHIIGNYRILSKIGEGGMGAVYVAEHTLLGRRAAIKVLLGELSHRQDLVTRFFNEARAASAVHHPGIVEIYDFGHHGDGYAYIVMEYLEGESLAARLRHAGTLGEVGAAALCQQIAGALGAAHARGIVHRDLKPDNIHIVRDPDIVTGERTKILDFGVAKLSSDHLAGKSMTHTGMVMGTPAYMSPEQCKGAGGVDHRTDLYALGCILFEMVCGRGPFVAETTGEVMAQHIYAQVPSPGSIRPVSEPLAAIILRLLAKDPSQRFQSAEDVIAALHGAVPSGMAARPSAATPMVVAAPTAETATAPPRTTLSQAAASVSAARAAPARRRAWSMTAFAVAALAGALAFTWSLHGRDRDDAPVATTTERAPRPPTEVAAPAHAPESAPPPPPMPAVAPSPAPTPERPPAPARSPAPASAAPPAPTMEHATLHLTSDPIGADVYRMPQRVHVGRTPVTYTMDAAEDEVLLMLRKQGFETKQIAVATGHDRDLSVALTRVVVKSPAHNDGSLDAGSVERSTPAAGSLDPFEKLGARKTGQNP